MAYEAVIGLECHIQLNTRSKMFCDCPAAFGDEPNSNVCPVCLGLPGALPRANRAAIDAALKLGLALGCRLREESVFARKNYFYPDMPKNYQITQYDRPLCEGGALPVGSGGRQRSFELIRVHVEEDTGKSFHPERFGDRPVSRVDFNRAGVPLLELVTQPVFRETAECSAFLTGLRRLARWLAISDGDMEKGHMRCDANVSIRPAGTTQLGTKTELKNLNSIRGVVRGQAVRLDEARLALPRQLGNTRGRFGHPRIRDAQHRQVGLGEIPIVVRVLLRAHHCQLVVVGVVEERGLLDAAAVLQHLRLPRDLGGDPLLHPLDRVQVLDLGLGSELVRSEGADRHVRVAAQVPLLHVAVRDLEPAHQPPQRHEERGALGGRAEHGLRHHLQERHAGAVEVDA